MPSKADIITAVQNLNLFLKVPELNGSTVKLNSNGTPYVFTGGFTMVFQFTKGATKWAFRVWHCGFKQQKERFKKISQYLEKGKLPYFEDIIYDEKSLLVGSEWVDTIRMKWLEGDLLKNHIEKNINNFEIIQLLADSFLEMFTLLHKHNISHGDLQHGNILIDEDYNIRLIDYDSVCVPDIEGDEELVTGLKGYQHPSRLTNASKASLKSDYFSELIIYLSLCAIAENPNLWDKYDVNNTEVLLFNGSDFENIQQSDIYTDLSNSKSETIQSLLKILVEYLNEKSYLNLEPFTKHKNFISWDIEPPKPVAKCCRCGKQINSTISYTICDKCNLEKMPLQTSENDSQKQEIERLRSELKKTQSERDEIYSVKSLHKNFWIILLIIGSIIIMGLLSKITNLNNSISSFERDGSNNKSLIEKYKSTIENLTNENNGQNDRIKDLESQLPQLFRTIYANQNLYFKCGNDSWVQLNCVFNTKGTPIYILLQKDGYGLTHLGGWIPMNRLEKQ